MFPTLVIDGFFDDPDTVVKFANGLNYFTDGTGDWPGTRTAPLYEIDRGFFNLVGNKIVSLFYETDVNYTPWYAKAMFQKVPNIYDHGWVHYDKDVVTAIVYLNKNANVSSGTSICRLKSGKLSYTTPEKLNEVKKQLYLGNISNEEARAAHKEVNDNFEETVNVKNLYNRLVVFDSNQWHKADNFADMEEERLTLIYFFTKIDAIHKPVDRMRRIK